jgi:hypothetical protein
MTSDEPLVMRWRWLPIPPLPLAQALPPRSVRKDDVFRVAPRPEAERAAFNFSFPTLSRQTKDLHFYRLIQIFNTPLRSLSSRDAGRSQFGYWQGRMPSFASESWWAHLWFYGDKQDGDLIVVEYGFEGGLTLWSRTKTEDDLWERYREICAAVNGGSADVEPADADVDAHRRQTSRPIGTTPWPRAPSPST